MTGGIAPAEIETVSELLSWAAATHDAKPAVAGNDGDGHWSTVSFTELRDLASSIGSTLAARVDATTGERHRAVAWIYGNDNAVVAIALHLAITSAGLLSVPVNPASGSEEVTDILARSRAAILLAPTAVLARRDDATTTIAIDDLDSLRVFAASAGPGRFAEVDPDAPAVVLFTSGTTGRSKGVVHSHRTSLAASRGWREAFGLTSVDTYQSMFPVYAGAGLHFSALACMLGGATNVVDVARPTAASLARVEAFGSTVYAAVPSIYEYWLSENLSQYDLTSLRLLDFGGSVMHRSTIEALRRALPAIELIQTYGLTEAGPGGLYLPSEHLDQKLGSIGSVGAGGLQFRIDTAVAGDQGLSAAPGEAIGELEVRGPSIMLGYLDDAETTARVFDGDWMRTGDLVRADADGFIYFLDRLKDLIIRGGFNISSIEVEEALLSWPGAVRIAAFGVPHHQLGEVVGVAVVAEDPAAFDLAGFRGHASERLPRVKVPAWIVVLDELPMSPAGKVLKSALREHPELVELRGSAP